MIKIIWNRKKKKKIKDDISDQFNVMVTTDPNEVPEHKIGLLLDDSNEQAIYQFVEKLMLTSYQLIFPTPEGFLQVHVKHVTYLEAFGDDIYMHFDKDQSQLIRQPLYQLEDKLKPFHFIRIGKSFIVNITKIRYIRTSLNAKLDLELIDGTHLEVSRSFVKSFKHALGILKKED